MLIETSAFPEISESNGNVKTARRSVRRNRNPKMAPILFVGMSCLGIAFPIISLRVSLPAYIYLGFLTMVAVLCGVAGMLLGVEIGFTLFFMNKIGD